ncbi:helix-turn-helix transcriptional regulator [Bacillus smithii]|uniref:helix-turn-helix domain-containing protein n=1 Tax=Bacillus smithii TaxID=1479 RepID=UPI0030C8E737
MEKNYGEFIKKHRILSGYKSQRQLAEKTGISSATISRIENEIQKPEVETLKQLAPYLTSTSLVELMVVCGYWDEDELLEEKSTGKELIGEYLNKQKETPASNEEEFIGKIDLSDEEILEQFDLQIDGRSLTEEETKGIIAYVRSLRQMKN